MYAKIISFSLPMGTGLCLSVFCITFPAGEGLAEIVDPGVSASVPVITADSQDNPHIISYQNGSLDVRYAYYDGSSWLRETVDAEGNVGDGHDIVVDQAGTPHVSYRDVGNGYLKYAKKTAGAWVTTVLDSNLGADEKIVSSSIVIDSQGHPHIAYHVEPLSATSYLRYASWNGQGWQKETPGISGYWPSLALDANSHAHMTFLNDQKIYYVRRSAEGTWSTPTNLDSSASVRNDPRLAVDSNNCPRVAYRDATGEGSIQYAAWNGTAWTIQTVAEAVGVTDEMDFALDAGNKPYIVYGDMTSERLVLARVQEGAWTLTRIDREAVCSIAVDQLCRAHMAYTYGFNSREIIKYVRIAGSSTSVQHTAYTSVADFDGDQRTDPTVVVASSNWYVWLSGSDYQQAGPFAYGMADSMPVAGDYDGDRLADPAVSMTNGNWYVWLSGSGYQPAGPFAFAVAGCIPVPADFDGDCKTDPAVFAAGQWYVWMSADGYQMAGPFEFGVCGDTPVPGDYDGDSRADPAVYLSGYWSMWLSAQGYVKTGPYLFEGINGDVPVPGDYDGDGLTDPAICVNGYWRIWLSSDGYTAINPGLFWP